jgi:hypothetical protein
MTAMRALRVIQCVVIFPTFLFWQQSEVALMEGGRWRRRRALTGF